MTGSRLLCYEKAPRIAKQHPWKSAIYDPTRVALSLSNSKLGDMIGDILATPQTEEHNIFSDEKRFGMFVQRHPFKCESGNPVDRMDDSQLAMS